MKSLIALFLSLMCFSEAVAQISNYTVSKGVAGSYQELSNPIATGISGDSDYGTIELPFYFVYLKNAYNTIQVSTNGWLGFGTAKTSSITSNNLASTTTTLLLAPLWDDLNVVPGNQGSISYQTLGSAPNRVFVVQWKNVNWNWSTSSGTPQNFQVHLYEANGVIEFQYGTMNTPNSPSASVGMIGPDGGNLDFISITPDVSVVSSRSVANNSITSKAHLEGETYRFTPNFSGLDLSVVGISSPSTSGCLTNANSVEIQLANFGANVDYSSSSPTITVQVSGPNGPMLTQQPSIGSIGSFHVQTISFPTTIDLSQPGTYTIEATLYIAGEDDRRNNSTSITVRQAAVITPPFSLGFDGFTGSNLFTSDSLWSEASGSSSPSGSTSVWTSQTGLGTSGNTTARINLYTNNRNEWIIGPKFRAASQMQLMYDVAVTDWNSTTSSDVMGSDDKLRLMLSTDCGASWTVVDEVNASDNLTPTLTTRTVSLDAYAGQDVIIAFLATDGPVDDAQDYDLHIDNVQIGSSVISETICYNSLPDTIKNEAIPVGGSGNYTFLWQASADGGTTWTAAPGLNSNNNYIPTVSLTDTTYFRRAVIDATCGDTAYSNSKVIYVRDSIYLNANLTAEVCGQSNGAIDLSISNGEAPFTYLWSNSATTEDLSGLSSGSYTVTVTDNFGCSVQETFQVAGTPAVFVSVQLDSNESCTGASDGGLSPVISGGVAPYVYLWSNGQTTEHATALTAGTYSLTVTDNNGCTATASGTVQMVDTIKPVVIGKNLTIYLDAAGQASLSVADVDSITTDDCSIASKNISKTSYNCFDLGVNHVYFTAVDVNGNDNTDTVFITVQDTISPTATVQNFSVYLNASGSASIAVSDIEVSSSDACGIDSTWLSQYNFGCGELGANNISYTAMDVNGNSTVLPAVVTVLDTITPVSRSRNLTAYLDASGNLTITPQMANNGSSDNCTSSMVLSLSKSAFNCGDEGLNVVSLIATDAAGNSHSSNFLLDIQDTISPVLMTQDITVQLSSTGQVSIAASQLDSASSDNCANQLFFTVSKSSFNCSNLGPNVVTVTATDGEGNSTSGTAVVNVEDNIAPVARVQNISVQLDANGLASITPSMLNNGSFDNCSVDSLWLSTSSFDCSNLGQNTVVFSVRDQSGNTSTTNAIVTVRDQIAPSVISQNRTVYLNASGTASLTATQVDNGSTDNCTLASLSLQPSSFSCADIGSNTVTLSATDLSGNTASATATVSVLDTLSPIVRTRNITLSLDATGNASISASDLDNGSSDNCAISTMTVLPNSFSCANLGANTVTITATDAQGNSRSKTATVTVVDQRAPLVATQNISLYLNASGTASIGTADIDNGSTDNCGIASSSLDISTFDCADLGQNLVMLSVTDNSGNTATASAIVTVYDTIDPSIDNLPANITAYLNPGQCTSNVQWPSITGSDNCSGVTLTSSQINGGQFPKGSTTVNVNLRDGSGNTTTGSFTVSVLDTIAPTISGLPTSFSITPNAATCDAAVSWVEPTIADNCGSVSITRSHTSGSTFPVGSTLVTYTATDSDGNSRSASFTVIVTDAIAPVIAGTPSNITQSADPGSCGAVVSFGMPVVSDNCSGATISASHASGSTFGIGTTQVRFTATDAAGNTSTSSFTITVEDDEKPVVLTVPASDTVGVCSAAYSYSLPTASDNCGTISVTQIAGLPSGNVFPAGITQNSFRISDAAGNDTVVSFTIVVIPQGQAVLPNVLEVCANEAAFDITLGQNIVWSGSGVVNGSIFNPALAGVGRKTLSYKFTDDYGCEVSGSISLTVLPVPAAPVIVQVSSTTLGTQASYSSYQWYRNGVAIPGATQPTYSYTQGGNYQVNVGNPSGCQLYGPGYVVGTNGGSIGLVENTLADLKLYPNPTSGQLTLDLGNQFSQDEVSLSLFGINGQLIWTKVLQSDDLGKVHLDMGNLPKATYFLRITNERNMTTRKVITY